jgi:hypothetical protein
MEKYYVAQSGRKYLLKDNVAEPCFNGAGFGVSFGTLADLERFDQRLRWDNISGQYN